ncbi:SDR family oxidoreductase [Streptomyces sp. NPDC005899]|uniref:SDR family oxidoreductase n=1 Tax=Streptomyces sp. NPDC005899 TaxID=3155716 RepID=UPI0033D5EC00
MIVVTGATGQYGSEVIEHLLRRGVPATQIVAAVRAPAKATALAAMGVEVRHADYDRPETLPLAFAGADKLMLVSSTGSDPVRIAQHRAIIDAAAKAEAGLVAYTSVTRATTNPMTSARVHRDTEQALTDAGLPTVLLRNGWYTENHTAILPDAVARGTIVGSAGQGQIASATRSDLAEAAAVVLTLDDQAGKIYDLTGDTAWTMPELAAACAAQTGKPVTYTDLPAERYWQILIHAGLPSHTADLIVDADLYISQGALAHIAGDLSLLLERPATPLTTVVARMLGT